MSWNSPGKDCGACGFPCCDEFAESVEKNMKSYDDCPYYSRNNEINVSDAAYCGTDIAGYKYDFVLRPFPDEPSARKYIVPFRADLVEKWDIKRGDLVTGRPAGPGCPVYHALRVLSANTVTGVLECHTVGPLAARKEDSHDIQAYQVHAFEGIAETLIHPPTIGLRQRFLPGFCMLDLSHTAVVNMVMNKKYGMHVRLEDIRII
ncbi:Fe-S cluster protein [Methanomicrobium antiquum]|uniref:Fe-S cluster protein n=1 Tax=Methanomicrobium antiquum TaxID=487686 RepID=A0AAF0JLY6_9EURY|nr:(Fe-S)-binding protein [Methanomicrobium antiquum]MDD4126107.1 (Fe-S)-binding protein [Methanomicrobium sp.]WFN37224.1 Fe-S cluster protein [Methanomicrobium antiquum]